MRSPIPRRFRDRPVGEIMVVMITFTVCFGVLASGTLVGILVIFRPEVDVTPWITRVTGLMNTMIGLLAGFLAGRTDSSVKNNPEPVAPPVPIEPPSPMFLPVEPEPNRKKRKS